MRALVIIAVLVLGGFTALKLMLYSIDWKGLEAEVAASAPALVPSTADMSPRLLADSASHFATSHGFDVPTEQIHVVRKAMRVGTIDIKGPVSVKGKSPEPLHDYEVTLTVTRTVLPLWNKSVTLKIPTMASCHGEHQGDGSDEFPPRAQ